MSSESDSERPTRETKAVVSKKARASSFPEARYSLSAFADLQPVCELRGYFVVGRIFTSAAGETYLAYRESHAQEGAGQERVWYSLKLLSPLVARRPELLAKVDQEIARSEQIDHPTIVSVTETVAAAEQRLVVFPWVRGLPLSASIRGTQPGNEVLRWDLAVQVFLDVCTALRDTMELGKGPSVHGAIIPQNIVVDALGRAHVLSLGLDVLRAGAHDLSIVYPFRAPEVRASGRATGAADVFGIGACLLELIAAGSANQLLEAKRSAREIVEEVCARAKCPMSLTTLLHRATAEEPARRFVSLASLFEALTRVPLVLHEEDLRAELVATLRDKPDLAFDRPPAMETADLRIAELAEKARLSDLSTDFQVEAPPEEIDSTDRVPLGLPDFDGDDVVLPRNKSRRPFVIIAAAAAILAMVGLWTMSGGSEETKQIVVSKGLSAEPEPVEPRSPGSSSSSPEIDKRSLLSKGKPVVAPSGDAAVEGGVLDLVEEDHLADGSIPFPDAAASAPNAAASAPNTEPVVPVQRPFPKRRRTEPKRPPKPKILTNPGF